MNNIPFSHESPVVENTDEAQALPSVPVKSFYKGTGAVGGAEVAKAQLLRREKRVVEKQNISAAEVEWEVERFKDAVSDTVKDLENLYTISTTRLRKADAAVIKSQLSMSQDQNLMKSVISYITNNSVTADYAVHEVLSDYIAKYKAIPVNGERFAKDTGEIREAILSKLNKEDSCGQIVAAAEKRILIAEEITAADATKLSAGCIAGVVTVRGGHDHTAVILRGLGIPYVGGVGDPTILTIPEGTLVGLNGFDGIVYPNPSPEVVQDLDKKKAHYAIDYKQLDLRSYPPKTLDGIKVNIMVNVEGMESIKAAIKNGVKTIGLYRTEFLYLDRDAPPSEDDQYANYVAAVLTCKEKKGVVTFRTVDFGGDKIPNWQKTGFYTSDVRGSRFYLFDDVHLEIFRTQLRALIRASQHGPLQIMFPMINNAEEFRCALSIAHEDVIAKLDPDDYNLENIKFGAMVETGAAVSNLENMLPIAEFISIGSNDLTEGMIQIKRQYSVIGHAFSEEEPSIVGAIKKIAHVCSSNATPVSICGDMASDPTKIPILLGCGIRDFSVSPGTAEIINGMISLCSTTDCEKLVARMIKSDGPMEARRHLENYLDEVKKIAASK